MNSPLERGFDNFLQTCCLIGRGLVEKSVLFREYLNYCKRERRVPVGREQFRTLMAIRGFTTAHVLRARAWQGLRLKAPVPSPWARDQHVEQFIQACCEVHADCWVRQSDLRRAYRTYCESIGEWPLDAILLRRSLKSAGITNRNGSLFWWGIQLKTGMQRLLDGEAKNQWLATGAEEYFASRCVFAPDLWMPRAALNADYARWCAEHPVRWPLSRIALATVLRAKGLRESRSHRIAGVQTRTWEGLALKVEGRELHEIKDAS